MYNYVFKKLYLPYWDVSVKMTNCIPLLSGGATFFTKWNSAKGLEPLFLLSLRSFSHRIRPHTAPDTALHLTVGQGCQPLGMKKCPNQREKMPKNASPDTKNAKKCLKKSFWNAIIYMWKVVLLYFFSPIVFIFFAFLLTKSSLSVKKWFFSRKGMKLGSNVSSKSKALFKVCFDSKLARSCTRKRKTKKKGMKQI